MTDDAGPPGATGTGKRWPPWWADALGVAWLLVFVVLYLSPALKDGPSFGPADLGRGLSVLTSLAHAAPNHNIINGDTITQGVPWNTLDWRLVHHGELPLWNGLSGNGMPQLLNFESAPFALPSLVGYLFPLSVAFLVTVAVKLLIAGTGTYVLCRLLGTRPLAAAFGGTTAMLSGSFAAWLGWSVTGPLAWAGWVVAACLLCARSRSRPGLKVALLAVAVAFAVYGGFPESYVLLAGALVVLLGVWGSLRLASRAPVEWRGIGRIGLGGLGGLALSAPLWLAGIPVLTASARNGRQVASGLPLHTAALLIAQGYDGLPIHGSYWFGPWNYYETASYVGVVAIVASVVAVSALWRRPVVAGLVVATLACLAVVYDLGTAAPVQHLVRAIGLGSVALERALPLVGFLVAVLAGLGVEVVVGRWRERSVQVGLVTGCALVAAAVALLWLKVGSAGFAPVASAAYAAKTLPTPATLRSLRGASLLWPTATVAFLVACTATVVLAGRRGPSRKVRWLGPALGAGLLGAQSAFLLFAGVGLNSYGRQSFPATPATAKLARLVGSSLVGLDAGNATCAPPAIVPPACGVREWRGIGLYPEINLGYGIDELALHDPTIPQATFDGWPLSGTGRRLAGTNLFAPAVDTLALARRYGVAYVLVAPGLGAPAGMDEVATLANNGTVLRLYSVPGSPRFSFLGPGGAAGGGFSVASDAVTGVGHPGDASYILSVRAPRAGELVARITDVPGWRASAGGRALEVRPAPGGLFEVRVPAGTRTVELAYAPARLEIGFLVAIATLVALAAWVLWGTVLSRRSRPTDPAGGRHDDGPLVASGGD